MVIVRMTEMYDMATTKGKIGLIGIHTPSANAMAKRWKGLFDNHRYYKILGVDVKIACASILPADPLQVGVSANEIAPQDMMNPLLYCTMTNEGWNTLVNRLYATASSSAGGIDTASIRGIPEPFSISETEQEYLYYQMLSSDKFRKAMPQNGLSMFNVKPFVHQVVATYGQSGNPVSSSQQGTGAGVSGVLGTGNPTTSSTGLESNQFIRGKAVPYPRLPCSLPGSTVPTEGDVPNGVPELEVYPPFKTFCACIVLPPAKLHEMYFRMLVSWKIALIQPCTMLEKVQSTQMGDKTDVYYRSYNFASAKELDEDELFEDDRADSLNSVDALNMAPDLVMEK